MEKTLKGYLIFTESFGWQVRFEYGEGQHKNLPIHTLSLEYVQSNGIEGEEVQFVIRGCNAPRTLNGVLTSALIDENR